MFTSAHHYLFQDRHAFNHPVVDEFDAHRPIVLVEEDFCRRWVQHYVEIRAISSGTQEGTRRRQSRAIPRRCLRYGEPRVRPSVQIDRIVAW